MRAGRAWPYDSPACSTYSVLPISGPHSAAGAMMPEPLTRIETQILDY